MIIYVSCFFIILVISTVIYVIKSLTKDYNLLLISYNELDDQYNLRARENRDMFAKSSEQERRIKELESLCDQYIKSSSKRQDFITNLITIIELHEVEKM